MDNDDFGINNPPFQRYVPPCYGKYQKYIPSCYMKENDGSPDKDDKKFSKTQGIDVRTNKAISVGNKKPDILPILPN
ncbi:hypothetical protein ES703_76299 [subsurface metagenome]